MAACCLQLSRAWSKCGSCWLSACCVGFSGCWVRVWWFGAISESIRSSAFTQHNLHHHNHLQFFYFSLFIRPPFFCETPVHSSRRFLHSLPVLWASYDLGGPSQPSLLPLPLPVPPLYHARHLPLHHCAHLSAAGVRVSCSDTRWLSGTHQFCL